MNGKTQTHYAWDSPRDAEEPQEWFHDIFRADHTPHDAEEAEFIKRTCAAIDEPVGARDAIGG